MSNLSLLFRIERINKTCSSNRFSVLDYDSFVPFLVCGYRLSKGYRACRCWGKSCEICGSVAIGLLEARQNACYQPRCCEFDSNRVFTLALGSFSWLLHRDQASHFCRYPKPTAYSFPHLWQQDCDFRHRQRCGRSFSRNKLLCLEQSHLSLSNGSQTLV